MRPTIEITTKGGFIATLNAYLTGGEQRKITSIFLEGVEVGVDAEGKPKMSSIRADVSDKAQDMAISLIVVKVEAKESLALSLEGGTPLERVLNLPANDFAEVVAKVEEVQSGLSEKKSEK